MTDKAQARKIERSPEGALPRGGLAEDILGSRDETTAQSGLHGAPATSGADQLYAFADTLAHGHDASDQKAAEEQLETWVTFGLAGESFGLPVSHVQEILRVTGITLVPHAPSAVRGVANMRGKVLPIVDLRVRLGIRDKEIDGHSRILVVSSRGRYMGLLVDAVQQVLRIARSKIQPPPPDVMTRQSDYILGVYHLQEALVILLEVDRVLLIEDSVSVQ